MSGPVVAEPLLPVLGELPLAEPDADESPGVESSEGCLSGEVQGCVVG